MTEVVPQLVSKEEYEKELKDLTEDYNNKVVELSSQKDKLNGINDTCLTQLLKFRELVYKNANEEFLNKLKSTESMINANISLRGECKEKFYDKQTECYYTLQKVRNMQNHYLVNIIKDLESQLNEQTSPIVTEDKKGNKKTRENNL